MSTTNKRKRYVPNRRYNRSNQTYLPWNKRTKSSGVNITKYNKGVSTWHDMTHCYFNGFAWFNHEKLPNYEFVRYATIGAIRKAKLQTMIERLEFFDSTNARCVKLHMELWIKENPSLLGYLEEFQEFLFDGCTPGPNHRKK